jgi:PAS domain S-box-containing protein
MSGGSNHIQNRVDRETAHLRQRLAELEAEAARLRHAERAWAESERRFRDVFENVRLVAVWLDTHGRITFCNDSLLALTGWRREEILGQSWLDVFCPDPSIRPTCEKQLAQDATPTQFEGNILTRQGDRRTLAWSKTVLRDAEGAVIGTVSLGEDITERKRVKETLKEREDILTSIFRAAPVGIGMVINRVIQEVNDMMCQITGYSRQELLGQSARMVYPSDAEFEYVGRDKYGQIAERGSGAVETRWKRKDGAIIHIVLSSTPLDTADLSKGVIFTALDITERKRAEEERLEMERRLLHIQKLESLGVLAGGIAHDFNNLLTAILGNLDVALLDLSAISPARPHVEEAMRACHRAADLTRQMLAYSGKGRFVVRSIDLSAVVKENVQIFGAAIARTATLNLHLARDLPLIQADPGQMQQVIMNLLTNASEALGENPGVITLATGLQVCDEAYLDRSRVKEKPPPGEFIYVEVSDTGSGMDERTQQRLFDPFFTTKFMGRGLGMSAVLGIVRGHRGAILVDSEVGRGTTIRVLFPVSEKDRTAEAVADQAGGPRAAKADRPSRSGTILVVDDEAMVRNPCQAMLEHLGFRVLAAADGQEAVEVFGAHADQIACVVLDLTMPRMDGVTAFRELRRLRPDVKVLLASGYNEQEATQRFVGQGLAGFIQKPYRLQDLEEKIEWVLSRTG